MPRTPGKRSFAQLQWPGRSVQQVEACDLQEVSWVTSQGERQAEGQAGGTLILGENAAVMTRLMDHYEGAIDLIYADPPFLTGKAYPTRIGQAEDSRDPSNWQVTRGYADTWQDPASYLNMLFLRLQLMHRLLSPHGSLYLHLDWHASAYARLLLDEIFGPERFLNEIIWIYHGPSPIRKAFKRKHDTILVYTKSRKHTFNADAVRVAYAENTLKTFASSPKAGFGKVPDLARGKVPEDWWYFPVVARLHGERTGYPTQKPEALLERILAASSNPGDLVADFFCGSGSLPVVASRLGRPWIACDLEPIAIHTTYRRLLLQDPLPPFKLLSSSETRQALMLKPEIGSAVFGPRARITLERAESELAPAPFPDNLAFWEIDWQFDGDRFISRTQAVRPWRSDQIDLHQEHTFHNSDPGPIAIRAVDTTGQVGMASLDLTKQP